MPRKESITKQDILQAAFEMAKQEGIQEVTARKLAAKAGCSTQPIFRVYKNMDELYEDVIDLAIAHFEAFYDASPKGNDEPFVNLGLAYIHFASAEKHLFQMLFLGDKRGGRSLYELLNGKNGNVVTEIRKASEKGAESPEELFMKMWIFIHGAASMTITGDYDLGQEETVKLLIEAYHSFE